MFSDTGAKGGSDESKAMPIQFGSRKDKGAKRLVTTNRLGPAWEDVVRRVTRDMDSCEVIANEVIHHPTDKVQKKRWEALLHRAVPDGPRNIHTILHFKDKRFLTKRNLDPPCSGVVLKSVNDLQKVSIPVSMMEHLTPSDGKLSEVRFKHTEGENVKNSYVKF